MCTQPCLTLCNPLDCSPQGACVHGDSPGKDTGVGCHALLQRIFPTQGLNLCLLRLLNWQVDSLLHHLGSPPLTKLKSKWSPTKIKQANQAIKHLNQTAQKKKKKKGIAFHIFHIPHTHLPSAGWLWSVPRSLVGIGAAHHNTLCDLKPSIGSLRVRHYWATSLSLFTFMHCCCWC